MEIEEVDAYTFLSTLTPNIDTSFITLKNAMSLHQKTPKLIVVSSFTTDKLNEEISALNDAFDKSKVSEQICKDFLKEISKVLSTLLDFVSLLKSVKKQCDSEFTSIQNYQNQTLQRIIEKEKFRCDQELSKNTFRKTQLLNEFAEREKELLSKMTSPLIEKIARKTISRHSTEFSKSLVTVKHECTEEEELHSSQITETTCDILEDDNEDVVLTQMTPKSFQPTLKQSKPLIKSDAAHIKKTPTLKKVKKDGKAKENKMDTTTKLIRTQIVKPKNNLKLSSSQTSEEELYSENDSKKSTESSSSPPEDKNDKKEKKKSEKLSTHSVLSTDFLSAKEQDSLHKWTKREIGQVAFDSTVDPISPGSCFIAKELAKCNGFIVVADVDSTTRFGFCFFEKVGPDNLHVSDKKGFIFVMTEDGGDTPRKVVLNKKKGITMEIALKGSPKTFDVDEGTLFIGRKRVGMMKGSRTFGVGVNESKTEIIEKKKIIITRVVVYAMGEKL
ncbi:hypothetical protein EIN_239420 [Entamoeba invadens IP1]|uniref:TLDc domain-containing protein n=1 Tax=Entamoeba invadens IP1 TaxID=370355 RepID=A0A0A1UCS1_ENTIV|nr:hypothetical protein EIN_239420 [Entamoeba invadens IP1]ELP93632.1 hypothetical protein EIN_239420 [Entamoeba invadens IP1]|eukprot:XP_004260403.1 hypothetical protein EIN_239420 [Entamoeba invadens IP1]